MSDPLDRLEAAAADYADVQSRIDEIGEEELTTVAEAYDDFTDLLDSYEGRATGDGDFAAFIQFQEQVARLTQELPPDVRHRDTFEAVDDHLQQRRLTESDFDHARDRLAPVADDAALLDERTDVLDRYRTARHDVEARAREMEAQIEDLERMQRLGEVDLDAPIEELREPIAAYNDAVTGAFAEFRQTASASEVIAFVQTTRQYPLVSYPQPPDRLCEYLAEHETASEPLPTLLEYADYSQSKLEHYVDAPHALKRAVATNQTYMDRLDAEPLTIEWPPRPAGELRFRLRELQSVVGRIASDDVIERLRAVREIARDERRFERLRESALAIDELSDDERERLQAGKVEDELAAARTRRKELNAALDEYPKR
jgi:hypothetical protein